jgi:hypothetical protein
MTEGRVRLVLDTLKNARAQFREFWSGDPRLPYQGWFGNVAKYHPMVAVALVASLLANASWLMFSIRSKWFRASAEQLLEAVRNNEALVHPPGWGLFSILGWVCGGAAILFAAMFLIAVVGGAVVWLRVNLRSTRSQESDKGK